MVETSSARKPLSHLRSRTASIARWVAPRTSPLDGQVRPDDCRSTLLLVPINVAPWLWGWPNRFLNRMNSVGSAVFVVGPYHGGDFSSGIDRMEDLSRLPEGYHGGVLTNEVETIAPMLRSRK